MTTIVTRAGKGSALSHTEMDTNLTNLNTDKAETTAIANMLETTDIGVTVQAYSANLDEYAAVNPTTAGLALLDDADSSAQLVTLGLTATAAELNQLDGVTIGTMASETASNYAKKSADANIDMNNYAVTEIKTATYNGEYDNGNSGASKTITLTNGQNQKITLTANTTLTITATDAGTGNYQIRLIQDATGSRTVTWSGLTSTRWLDSSTEHAINTSANGESLLILKLVASSVISQAISKIGTA